MDIRDTVVFHNAATEIWVWLLQCDDAGWCAAKGHGMGLSWAEMRCFKLFIWWIVSVAASGDRGYLAPGNFPDWIDTKLPVPLFLEYEPNRFFGFGLLRLARGPGKKSEQDCTTNPLDQTVYGDPLHLVVNDLAKP